MFKIEKNIPLAAKQSYPFDEMQPGDSFFVPVADPKKIGYVRAQINNFKKSRKDLVTATRVEEAGLRVWLISKEKE